MEVDLRISVIIPTFNREKWVTKAIDSVQSQTHPVHELIVIDDGSTDHTLQRIDEKKVKILTQKNKGPSAARNLGARHAEAPWLAFLDSDDCWLPEKINHQVSYLKSHPESKWCYTDESWIRKGKRVNACKHHAKSGGMIFENCIPLCIVSPSSVVIEKETFLKYGGFDEDLPAAEDYDLWLRLSLHHEIGYIAKPLIEKYGGHEDQLSGMWGIDRYRIKALEKILSEPTLNRHQQLLVLQDIVRRCDILVKGFKKHGKENEAREYELKKIRWQQVFHSLG